MKRVHGKLDEQEDLLYKALSESRQINSLSDANNEIALLLQISPSRVRDIHEIIKRVDKFLSGLLSAFMDPVSNKERDFLAIEKKYLDCIVRNIQNFLFMDPLAHSATLPIIAKNWSINMLAWVMMGKAVVIRNGLYRLHPAYTTERFNPSHPSKEEPVRMLFTRIIMEKRRENNNSLPDTLNTTNLRKEYQLGNKFGNILPFETQYMLSLMDSEYLRACGVVNSGIPILCLKLTQFCTQVRTLHANWSDSVMYHKDIWTALALLEMRAFMFASFQWDAETLDITPGTPGYNLVNGGQGSNDATIVGLTRGSEDQQGRRSISHRFVFEMQKFFMNTHLCLLLHDHYPHVSVKELKIPQWNLAENSESWKRYLEEMRDCNSAIKTDVARDNMAKLLRVLRTRPCEKEMYKKAIGVSIADTTQTWYEHRPGEAIARSRL